METKTYPKGTTKEQWDRYYEYLKRHEERCEREKPKSEDYVDGDPLSYDHNGFNKAMNEWEMMRSCDAPNKPGYYRANND